MDERILDAQRRLRAAATAIDQQHPEWLRRNVGQSCFNFLDALRQRLGAGWYFVGKTTRDGGKFRPASFEPRGVRYRGEIVPVIAVSHDVLFWLPPSPIADYPDGVQFDVLASANWWDVPYIDPATNRQAVASIAGGVIPPEEYRAYNPPAGWTAADDPGATAPTPAPVPQPATLEFPPRDFTLRFLNDLDAEYARRGREGVAYTRRDMLEAHAEGGHQSDPVLYVDGLGPREGHHVDHEGLAVWLSEFLRRWATGDFPPVAVNGADTVHLFEIKYAAVRDAVFADIAAAWR